MYVTNENLLIELRKYKDDLNKWKNKIIVSRPKMSEELGTMILLIAKRLSTKPNFSGYTYKDDLIAEAVLTVIKYLDNFDLEKSSNPFSYITQIIYNSFILNIKKNKKHSQIKDACFQGQNIIDHEVYTQKSIDYTIFKNFKEEENEISIIH